MVKQYREANLELGNLSCLVLSHAGGPESIPWATSKSLKGLNWLQGFPDPTFVIRLPSLTMFSWIMTSKWKFLQSCSPTDTHVKLMFSSPSEYIFLKILVRLVMWGWKMSDSSVILNCGEGRKKKKLQSCLSQILLFLVPRQKNALYCI